MVHRKFAIFMLTDEIYKNLLQFTLLDLVCIRESGTVSFATVPFGTEPVHTSHVNAKQFHVVPGVITVKEDYVVKGKEPVLLRVSRI